MATSYSLEQFAERMRLRSEELSQGVDLVVKKAALAADQAVVLATPVDTGRARSNWIVSLGSERFEVIPPYSPGSKLGLGEGANAAAAIAQGAATIVRRKEEQAIFIVNNVMYIRKLNDGSSAQAPANFVQIAVIRGINAIQGVRIFNRL